MKASLSALLLTVLMSVLGPLATSAVAAGDALQDFVAISRLRDLKNHPETETVCQQFLRNHPDTAADATVRLYLAQAYFDQRKYERAIESATDLLQRKPEPELLEATVMLRGEARRYSKDHRESIPDFQRAFELAHANQGPNAPHALYHIIQAHHELKQTAAAQEKFELLKEAYPDSSYVRTATTLLARKTVTRTAPRPTGPKVGVEAPDIEMIRLKDDQKIRLSDFKGKVVVMDFWASWCGPCQAPMTKMQTYREKHPEWGDKVELVALSIDNTRQAAVQHLEKKGWDKTYNVWAGEGGFRAPPPTAYGIRGIPTAYVIGPDGKVAATGHPNALDIPTIVNGLLKK